MMSLMSLTYYRTLQSGCNIAIKNIAKFIVNILKIPAINPCVFEGINCHGNIIDIGVIIAMGFFTKVQSLARFAVKIPA